MKRQIVPILLSWILFIGVDFLIHAGLLASLWKEDIAIYKPLKDLALLIPVGYASFLLLTILIGYLFFKLFQTKPPLKEVLKFGFTFGLLFSLSNLLGLFSYLIIPVKHLIIFHLVYFIEIIIVTLSLYFTMFSQNIKRVIWLSILIFFMLIIMGIVLQNII